MTCMTLLFLLPLTSFPSPWLPSQTKWPNSLAQFISSDSSSFTLAVQTPLNASYSHRRIRIHQPHPVTFQSRKSWLEHGLLLPLISHGMQDQVNKFKILYFFFKKKVATYIERSDLSTSTLESALFPLSDHLACEPCQKALNDRIKNLVKQWSMVKVRLFLSIIHNFLCMYVRWPYEFLLRVRYCDAIHGASTPQALHQQNEIARSMYFYHCKSASWVKQAIPAPNQKHTLRLDISMQTLYHEGFGFLFSFFFLGFHLHEKLGIL